MLIGVINDVSSTSSVEPSRCTGGDRGLSQTSITILHTLIQCIELRHRQNPPFEIARQVISGASLTPPWRGLNAFALPRLTTVTTNSTRSGYAISKTKGRTYARNDLLRFSSATLRRLLRRMAAGESMSVFWRRGWRLWFRVVEETVETGEVGPVCRWPLSRVARLVVMVGCLHLLSRGGPGVFLGNLFLINISVWRETSSTVLARKKLEMVRD